MKYLSSGKGFNKTYCIENTFNDTLKLEVNCENLYVYADENHYLQSWEEHLAV